jgi:hypothetical protein
MVFATNKKHKMWSDEIYSKSATISSSSPYDICHFPFHEVQYEQASSLEQLAGFVHTRHSLDALQMPTTEVPFGCSAVPDQTWHSQIEERL